MIEIVYIADIGLKTRSTIDKEIIESRIQAGIMIDIKKTDDNFADFYATQEEWDGLKAIVSQANTMFDDTELYLDMTAADLAELHKELQTHYDLPAPFETVHLRHLLLTVSRTETMIVPEMSSNDHKGIVKQLENINMLDVFDDC